MSEGSTEGRDISQHHNQQHEEGHHERHHQHQHQHQHQHHHHHSSEGNDSNVPLSEQDRYLPIANISRIMKKALVSNAKIAKDAKETVQECVSEFISFITSEASDKCQQEKRKTINGEDILWAMQSLGFDSYYEPLNLYLQKYRELGEKTTPKQKGSSNKLGGSKKETLENVSTTLTPPQHQMREIFHHPSYLQTAQPSYLQLQSNQSQSFSDSDSSNEVKDSTLPNN